MKRIIILFLVIILFSVLVMQIGALEQLDYAEIWGIMDEGEKTLFLFGTLCGIFQDIILLAEFPTDDMKVMGFVLDYFAYIAKYVSFYDEDEDSVDAIIGSINGFYSDPDNKYCNPAGLAFIGYLQLQGKDISKELTRLRWYAEVGTEVLFKK